MDGLFGEVGTKETDELAIKTLMPYKLDEQICIKKKIALKNLEYMGYEKYEVK